MDSVGVAERVERIVGVRDDVSATDDLVESGLVAVREIQSSVEAQHAALVAKLSTEGFVEARVANAAKTSIGAARKSTQRAATLGATPKLADVLGDGQATAGHVDAVTRAAPRRSCRWRSAASCSIGSMPWPMWPLPARWSSSPGGWRFPVEIPARVLAELAGDVDAHAVVVRNGVVLYAPGELNLGRTTRLANRAQRRALRAVYRGCAIPGCSVAYDRCRLHHLIWWRNGGATDLDNLLPLCTKHHGKVHHDGWVIELGPNRELALRLPDGTVHNTGPPGRRTAA